jgi:NAD(P)H-nitrite reductase large subunit
MKIVIIGAGPAGITAAETLRQYNRQVDIVMLSGEPFPPYAPPAMIEYFMTGREAHFWKGKDITDLLGLDYRPGTQAEALLPDQHAIRLDNGVTLGYDRLVIATGSRLYAPVPGADLPGVYNFKSISAAEDLVKQVREKGVKRALVIGAGFIGVEIALLLRNLGVEVIQIEKADRVMPLMLDMETAQIVLDQMAARGIDVRLNTEARAVVGENRAEAVEIEGGGSVSFDVLIAATGVKPNIEFIEGSGIEADWGIIVDDHLRTTIPDVYAAGDAAETRDRIRGERYVHAIFPNAVAQGRLAALNISGLDVTYEGADSMNSLKHLGIPVMAAGEMEGEELRARSNSALRKLFLADDRIVGFRMAGDISAAGIYRALMNKKVKVGPFKHKLLSPEFGMGIIETLALSPSFSL